MKRLAIFVFFDKQGIVDRYVLYILKQLKTVCDNIIIVSNSSILEDEKLKLLNYSENIIQRENKGYDGAAFKEIIEDCIRNRELYKYDELILINDTFYGPFLSFSAMISDMENKNVDFWGIIKYLASNEIPEHIQSYFLLIRKKMLYSKDFEEFWNNFVPGYNYDTAIENYELAFTRFFARRGYIYDSYVDSSKYAECIDAYNRNPIVGTMLEFVRDLNCPILKRKNLLNDYFRMDQVWSVMEYIRKYKKYDLNMIWENLLRLYGYDIIYKSIKPVFTINTNCKKIDNNTADLLIVAYLQNDDNLDYCINALQKFAEEYKVIVITNRALNQLISPKLKNCECIIIEKQHTPLKYLLLDMKNFVSNYKYLLYLNNDKVLTNNCVKYMDNHLQLRSWYNLALNNAYISNVLDLFREHENLGIIYPPLESEFSSDFNLKHNWEIEYEALKRILFIQKEDERFTKKNIPPVSGNSFFITVDLLRELWSYDWSSYTIINKEFLIRFALPVLCQKMSMFYGKVINDRSATALYMSVNNITDTTNQNQIEAYNASLRAFIKRYKKIMIYGAGKTAERIFYQLKNMEINVDGFIVSDGMLDNTFFMDRPVLESSGVISDMSNGIILAMAKKNRVEVINKLNELENYNYFVLT